MSWRRRLGVVGLLGVMVLGCGGLGTIGLLTTDAGKAWVLDAGLSAVRPWLLGDVQVGALQTDFWTEATFVDVHLMAEGREVVSVESVHVTLDGWSLGRVVIDGFSAEVDGSEPGLFLLVAPDVLAMVPAQSFDLVAEGRVDAAGLPVEALRVQSRAELQGVLKLTDLEVRAQVMGHPLNGNGTAVFSGDAGSVETTWSYREATATVAGSAAHTSEGLKIDGEYGLIAGPLAVSGTAGGVWPALSLETVTEGLHVATGLSLGEGSQHSEVRLTNYELPIEVAAPLRLNGACTLHGALPEDELRAEGSCSMALEAVGWSTDFDGTLSVRDVSLRVQGETHGGLGRHEVHAQLTPTSVRATTRGRVPLGAIGLSGGSLLVESTILGPAERLDVEAVVPSGPISVEGVAGIAEGRAAVVVQGGGVSGHLSGSAVGLVGRGVQVESVELRSSVRGSLDALSGQGEVVTNRVIAEDVTIRPEPVAVQWSAGRGWLRGDGSVRAPFETRGVDGLVETKVRLKGREIGLEGWADAAHTRARFVGEVDLAESVLELSELSFDRGDLALVEPGRIRLEPDGPAIDRLDFGTARISGSLDAPEVALDGFPIERLRDWVPELPSVGGAITGQLRLGGDGVAGHLVGRDLWQPGVGFTALVDAGVLEGELSRDGSILGWVRGTLPSALDGDLNLRIRVDRASSERIPELGLPVEALASADVRISGPARHLDLSGWASVHSAGVDTEVRFDRTGDAVHTDGLVRRDGQLLAHFDGRAGWFIDDGVEAFLAGTEFDGPWVGLPSGQVLTRGLPVTTVAELAGLPVDVDGTLVGRAQLTDGVPSGAFRWRKARIGEVEVPDAHLRWEDAFVAEMDFVVHEEAHAQRGRRYRGDQVTKTLSVRGPVPVHLDWLRGVVLDEVVELDISGEVPVGVASAVHPSIQDGVGVAVVSGTVRLEPAPLAPLLDVHARVDVHDGAITARRLGLRADDIDLEAEIDGTDVVFHTALRTRRWTHRGDRKGRPSIDLSGRATLGLDGLHGLRGEVALRNALVIGRRRQKAWVSTVNPLVLSGELPRRGPWDSNLRVRGDLRVDRADLSLDKQTLMEAELWDGPARILDRRILRLGEPYRPHRDPDPFWSILDAQVGLELGSDAHGSLDLAYFEQLGVLGTEASTIAMEGSLVGHVDLAVAGGVPSVEGQLDLARGTARMVRSYFDLESGSISFVDGDPFRPFVDVEGTLALDGGGTVELGLIGTPSDARVSLSSGDLVSSDQVLAAVITRENPNSNSGAAAALSLAAAIAEGVFFGGMDLGNFEVRDGYLRYPLAFGPRLRLTPGLGMGTGFAQDVLRMDVGYLATPRLGLHGTVGLSTARGGLVWRRRF